MFPATTRRVQRNTDVEINARIRRQIEANVAALDKLEFSPEELAKIDALTG